MNWKEPGKELFWACSDGSLEDVKAALSKGANPNWRHEEQDEETAIIAAARRGSTDIVKYLVENTTANVVAQNIYKWTPLMFAARRGHTDIVKYLLENTNQHVNDSDIDSWTSFHWAACYDHLKVVKLLLDYGADRDCKNKDGKTPLDVAKKCDRRSTIAYLMKAEISLVKRAMQDGVIKVFIMNALIIGHSGVGKTSIGSLLLDLPPPPRRTSTPLATRATRAFYRVKPNNSRDVTWTELNDDTYLKHIAVEMKMIEPGVTPPFTKMSLAVNISTTQVLSSGTVSKIVYKLATNLKLMDKQNTFVHLIDSGGHPSLIGLVPAFVRGSIVIIVASKLNHSLSDKLKCKYMKNDQHLCKPTNLRQTQLEGIEQVVHTLSSLKCKDKSSSEPKILFIGTHADKLSPIFDETLVCKNQCLKRRLGELKSMCIETSQDGDILLPVNTQVKENRSKIASSIRQKIMDAYNEDGIDIPTRWYIFDLELTGKAKKEGRGVLSLAECFEIGGNLSMGEKDVMAALVFLDDAALCLYFQAAAPHLVFTDSQAILDEVTEIMNLGIIDLHLIFSLYPFLSAHMALVQRLREQGLFNKKLVDIVCSKYRVNEEGKCSYTVENFLAILQQLLIIAPVCINEEELFFIPSILSACNKISHLSRKLAPLPRKLVPLVLLSRTRAIPLGMFSALVVALLSNQLFALEEIYGCNAVSFKCKLGGVVLLVEYHAWLTVHFNGHPSAAPRIKAAIHSAIGTVCRQRQLDTNKVVFIDGFICPFKKCAQSSAHPCIADTTTKQLICSVKPDIAYGPCNDNMLAWLDTPDVNTEPAAIATAKSLPSSSTGTDTVSQFQFMEAVASKIPAKWRTVGTALGITTNILDSIDKNHGGNSLECFSDVFTCWQQQSTPQNPANWATLITVLQSNYIGEDALSDHIQNTLM